MTQQSHSALSLRRLSPRIRRLGTTPANAGGALDNINTTLLPDGSQCFVIENRVDYMLDKASTATADGTRTIAPAAGGPGRWLAARGSGAYRPKIVGARNATTTALAAYTRTGNVIVADANGALGAIDAITNVVGDDLFLKDPAAGEDGGVYTINDLGSGSTPFRLTRKAGYDKSDKVNDGDLIEVGEGTANGDKTWRLTTDDDIVLNTTSLTFRLELDPVDIGVSRIQVAGGTFVAGTATIAAGITVAAGTDAFVVMSAVITGSINVGGIAHLKASNVVGGPGVGAVTLNILGANGALDADAAGAFRVLLID